MRLDLAIMAGVATAAGAAGLTLLVKPAAARALLSVPEGEPALYALRIAGMMLAALGLMLGSFATVGSLVLAA
ncbi:hypothetical protein [Sphingomonas sp. M1-B02]|uniref:hypothetical protein n=1 Tax=Sphingomonas sp. M1-B02 TaxID=3114300 RepID=UPI00223FC78C|nr:hypothetical protein [Sphingomonas sp. S6-11]UZK64818.1 hypothetical protein OKW87_09755 [Sphingomonas sp. S6-11]